MVCKKIVVLVCLAAILITGCSAGDCPQEQAQIDQVATRGTKLSRGDFFEFPGECFALNLWERPFDREILSIELHPGAGRTLLYPNDLAYYGARLVPKERREEALNKWVLQSHRSACPLA